MGYTNLISTETVVIANGQSLSGASASLSGRQLVGVITDAEWDTNAMTYQASVDGVNYFNLFYEASEYSQTGVTASTYRALNPNVFYGVRYIKVRSGTAGSPVSQSGATTITLVLRPM